MVASFYILVDRKGNVDFRKTANFSVSPGHVATRIEVEIPDEAFEPVPLPTVRFVVPAEALRRAVEVQAEVVTEVDHHA